MWRVLSITENEFLALVRTRFFIVGIIFMPLLMAGLFAFANFAQRQVDRTDRRFGVVDDTGVLYDGIARAAARHNEEAVVDGRQVGPRFLPVHLEPERSDPSERAVRLSARVTAKEFFAFIVIPAGVLTGDAAAAPGYYSDNTAYRTLSLWLQSTVNDEVQKARFQRAGIDPALVESLSTRTDLSTFGLVERRPDGTITPAQKIDEMQRFGVPVFLLVIIFMSVMSNAQHLINTIIEEKMSKISEVLLGSVSAFQLLMGKLLGIVAVSLLLSLVYLAGGVYTALSLGRPDLVQPALLGWFLLFLVCASAMFGALFQALSSACSDLKDAQSMLQPAMMILIVAYLTSFVVIRSPDSTMAAALSIVPFFAPFAMMLRLALAPGPPFWQVALSVVLLVATTLGVVWAAGRIFRVGLLMQGKPPNLPELLRWIRQ
jgi:ABC-2 type transport system permease protein